jgi:hypothetical protein
MGPVFVLRSELQADADAAAAAGPVEWKWLRIDSLRTSADWLGVEFHVQWKPSCGWDWPDSWEPESSFVSRLQLWGWLEEYWLQREPLSAEASVWQSMITAEAAECRGDCCWW